MANKSLAIALVKTTVQEPTDDAQARETLTILKRVRGHAYGLTGANTNQDMIDDLKLAGVDQTATRDFWFVGTIAKKLVEQSQAKRVNEVIYAEAETIRKTTGWKANADEPEKRRTQQQERWYACARDQWRTVLKVNGLQTTSTQGANNRKTDAEKETAKLEKAQAIVDEHKKEAVNSVAAIVQAMTPPEKTLTQKQVMAKADRLISAAMQLCNANASVMPMEYKSIIHDCKTQLAKVTISTPTPCEPKK